MTGDDAGLWTDRSRLQDVQYRTDANLAARQSIYAYQRPRLALPSRVLGLAALRGGEIVADIGCGNGSYLAELARRRHAGPVLGVDLSSGMLRAARSRAPGASLVCGDAAALPLCDDASSLTLAMHMLYHVPEPLAAVRELRRITHPAGQVLVVLNGEDHLRELRDLITAALCDITKTEPPLREGLRLDDGEDLLASEFSSITRHDFPGELLIPGPQPVEGYVRSMVTTQDLPDPGAFAAAVSRRVPIGDQGVFRVRTHTGCLVCSLRPVSPPQRTRRSATEPCTGRSASGAPRGLPIAASLGDQDIPVHPSDIVGSRRDAAPPRQPARPLATPVTSAGRPAARHRGDIDGPIAPSMSPRWSWQEPVGLISARRGARSRGPACYGGRWAGWWLAKPRSSRAPTGITGMPGS